MSEWYETFFDALAFDVWRRLVPAEASDAEAAFLLRQLDRGDGARCRLLDVPCGEGRLALRVAAAGHDVVGVDRAEEAVARLRHDAGAARAPVTALVGDMRQLGPALAGRAPFDGAWCMGNSFGYLDSPDTARFLHALSASLCPGARFVLDAAIAAECVLRRVGERDRYEAGGAILVNVNSYDAPRSTLVTDMTLAVGERRAQRTVRHRILTCREIVESLERADLMVDDVFAGLDGQGFTLGAPRCLLVATRR